MKLDGSMLGAVVGIAIALVYFIAKTVIDNFDVTLRTKRTVAISVTAVAAIIGAWWLLTQPSSPPGTSNPLARLAVNNKKSGPVPMVVYQSSGGRYEIMMPAPVQTATIDAGNLKVNLAGYEQSDGSYSVMYCDLPATALAKGPDVTLDNGCKNSVANVKGTISRMLTVTISGYPGREVEGTVPDGGVFRMRSYLIGERVYQLFSVGKRQWVLSGDGTKFFESFKPVI